MWMARQEGDGAVSIFASAGRGRVQILSFSVIRCLKVFYTFPLSLILAQSHTGHWVATSSGAPSRGKRIAGHVTLVESASAVSYLTTLRTPDFQGLSPSRSPLQRKFSSEFDWSLSSYNRSTEIRDCILSELGACASIVHSEIVVWQ